MTLIKKIPHKTKTLWVNISIEDKDWYLRIKLVYFHFIFEGVAKFNGCPQFLLYYLSIFSQILCRLRHSHTKNPFTFKNIKNTLFKGDKCRKCKKKESKSLFKKPTIWVWPQQRYSSFYLWLYYIHLSRVDIYNSKWKIAYIKDFLYIN